MLEIEDAEAYKAAKPALIGLAAMLITAMNPEYSADGAFDVAERLAAEFEKRNEIA
jgi:hypothetical protein